MQSAMHQLPRCSGVWKPDTIISVSYTHLDVYKRQTLDMLQELYEEKLVTYPRTDSQFVTEDMRDTVEELVGKMPVLLPFLDYGQLGRCV